MTNTEPASSPPSTPSPSTDTPVSGTAQNPSFSSRSPTSQAILENRTLPNRRPSSSEFLQPYLFVSCESVPIKDSMPVQIATCLTELDFQFEDIKTDEFGYYITFPHTEEGRIDALRCFTVCHRREVATYKMVMVPFLRFHKSALKDFDGRSGRHLPRPLLSTKDIERISQLQRDDAASKKQRFSLPRGIPGYTEEDEQHPKEVAAEIAMQFGYTGLEHFMSCMNLKTNVWNHFREAEALLLSWRAELSYVMYREGAGQPELMLAMENLDLDGEIDDSESLARGLMERGSQH